MTDIMPACALRSSSRRSASSSRRNTTASSPPTCSAASLAERRALENVTFVAMANRVGREGGFTSLGWSCVASPSGHVLAGLEEGEGIAAATVTLDSPDLARWRAIASYRSDRRPEIYGPGASAAPRER